MQFAPPHINFMVLDEPANSVLLVFRSHLYLNVLQKFFVFLKQSNVCDAWLASYMRQRVGPMQCMRATQLQLHSWATHLRVSCSVIRRQLGRTLATQGKLTQNCALTQNRPKLAATSSRKMYKLEAKCSTHYHFESTFACIWSSIVGSPFYTTLWR